VADNPSLTLADALSLSQATNIGKFEISALSVVPLIDNATGLTGVGENWNLGLEGQIVNGATVIGANVYNAADASSTDFKMRDCHIGNNAGTPAVCSLPPCRADSSSIDNGITLLAAGNYQFIDCVSGVAGAGAPEVDFDSLVATITAEFRRWSGGLILSNIAANHTISVDALTGGTLTLTFDGGGTVEARGAGMKEIVVNGAGGTVNVAGFWGKITDNSGGNVTIDRQWLVTDSIYGFTIETGLNMQESMTLANAANAGKLSGAGTTEIAIRDAADTKDRINMTVDSSGNRTIRAVDVT
jgi:hypothetical protein